MQNIVEAIRHDHVETANALKVNMMHTLRAIREMMGFDVVFISKFEGPLHTLLAVDKSNMAEHLPIHAGTVSKRQDTLCQRAVDGRFPKTMSDVRSHPDIDELPMAVELPILTHVTAPIEMDDGKIYGTLCGFTTHSVIEVSDRDIEFIKIFAKLTAKDLQSVEAWEVRLQKITTEICDIFSRDLLYSSYQPIVDIRTREILGYEALARFNVESKRTPDQWFAAAELVGEKKALEILAVNSGLRNFEEIKRDHYMSINVSADVIQSDAFMTLIQPYSGESITIEVTEHEAVMCYESLVARTKYLQDLGFKIAIDDVGAGYSNFRHIFEIEPDILKLDRSIVSNIDTSNIKTAFAASIAVFSEKTSSEVIAEGIEREEERIALINVGIINGQGYLFGRPEAWNV